MKGWNGIFMENSLLHSQSQKNSLNFGINAQFKKFYGFEGLEPGDLWECYWYDDRIIKYILKAQ